jgi:hypothetical protein
LLLLCTIVSSQTLTLFSAKTLSGSDVKTSARKQTNYPSQLDSVVLVQPSTYLHANLELNKLQAPKQVFLRFVHKSQDYSGILTFSKKKGAGNAYSIAVSADSQFKEFVSVAGDYNVDVLIAGGNITKPIAWNVASAKVTLDYPPAKKSRYDPGHLIAHIFREADKRAPEMMSLVFTGLCIAPLLLFINLIGRIGFKFAMPSRPFYTLVFSLSIGGILALLTIYWIGISIFYAFQWLFVLCAVSLFSGLKAFSDEYVSVEVSSSKKKN